MSFDQLTAVENVHVLLMQQKALAGIVLSNFAEARDKKTFLLALETQKDTFCNLMALLYDIAYEAEEKLGEAIAMQPAPSE